MIKRFYFRYDSHIIYDTDDLMTFLEIVTKIQDSERFEVVAVLYGHSAIIDFNEKSKNPKSR